MQIKVTLDAGINIYSTEVFMEEVDPDMWDSMGSREQEEFIKEIALQRVNWEYEIIP